MKWLAQCVVSMICIAASADAFLSSPGSPLPLLSLRSSSSPTSQRSHRWQARQRRLPASAVLAAEADDAPPPEQPDTTVEEEVAKTPVGAKAADVPEDIHLGERRPRITVKKSNNHIYAMVVDDEVYHTLASACTLSPEIRPLLRSVPTRMGAGERLNGDTVAAAYEVGKLLGKKSLEKGIWKVWFDRGQYRYHGKVKAVAEGARAAGLDF
ncbi:unnamed protein product [Vitrella brassicaformis CCMP3155]|uniref:Large ribosomal subunit protein uL18c n=1 Tax=Vitrella brassicaformis (strain CCMP3155) TaxID=1169540 RepID=A0A0G4H7C4_VITBC|nr:unnamed protein product [Vitrella brassicaformis CCMP3155]|eukprot:CEM39645.1 unnamed protein product [Vitrella brassicaformis CCMP3155]